MEKANSKKLNRWSKYYLEFIQLVAMGLLFLFVFNKELVIFVKEFISALPVGGGLVESIAIRGYVVFNMLANSPSLIVLLFAIFQVVIFAKTVTAWLIICCTPFSFNKENVVVRKQKVECYCRDNKSAYLENSRLLF